MERRSEITSFSCIGQVQDFRASRKEGKKLGVADVIGMGALIMEAVAR